MSHIPWIGVDLDGTLAHYDGWRGPEHIGEPVPAMVERVRRWLTEGHDVRVFTARVGRHASANERARIEVAVHEWTLKHLGRRLEVTCEKDMAMVELWDDRAVRVVANTGQRCCGGPTARDAVEWIKGVAADDEQLTDLVGLMERRFLGIEP